jgi:hypothetical protein
MLTRAEIETIALQASEFPQHNEAAKAKLQAIAGRKHEREAADFAEFKAVDQAAYATRVLAAVVRATGDLEAARDAVTEAEGNAAAALQAERVQQDRVRDTDEHARLVRDAWKQVQGRGTPREQTDALVASQAADQVARGEQAALEGKTASRVLADSDLETARARVTELEAALRTTKDLADHPGRPLYSPETCAENVAHMLRIWDQLQPLEQQFVRNTITMFAVISGVADDLKAKGAAEREAELEGQRPEHGAFTMPVAMPGTAGR